VIAAWGGYRAPQITGISYDRGLASFNIVNSFVASGHLSTPDRPGQGRFWAISTGPLNYCLGGWVTNGILTLNSGPPQYIPCQITTTATTSTCYADVVPGVSKYRSGGPAHYYNPAAFTDPPVATTIGTSDLAPLGGSNTQVNGPGFRDLDFSVFKEFGITETNALAIPSRGVQLYQHSQLQLAYKHKFPGHSEFRAIHGYSQQRP